jgi:hypothetical protein
MSYSFLDLAHEVLKGATRPLTYQEIWKEAQKTALTAKLETAGKTPWQTLGARLYVDVQKDGSQFVPVRERPMRFFLKERQAELPSAPAIRIEEEETRKHEKKTAFHERDLHPLLTHFAFANLAFNRGRSKTIWHEKSTKTGYSEWTHPDMVGFYLPIDDWRPSVIAFNRLSDNNSLRLFSFEVKKALHKGNYRESYFQAVSNSSWAHEGYLVAAGVQQDDEFLAELERLASSFGIGIIHLDPSDIDASRILYPARRKESLDWEAINKLCEQNPDFEKFLEDVKIAFESRRVHKSEYDEVLDITRYIKERMGIQQDAGAPL